MKCGFEESVRGQIIGGDSIVGHLYYEDRKQGPDLYSDNADALIAAAKAQMRELKSEAPHCYPGNLWTIRIMA